MVIHIPYHQRLEFNHQIIIMNKFKSLVLAVIGLLCSLSVSAEDFEVDGIYYNITSSTDMTVEVTYRGNSYNSYWDEYSGAVKIPESVTYDGRSFSVICIGDSAFFACHYLSSVEIPNSVTSIGSSAFHGCDGLTSVVIPNSVTSIGGEAFYFCDGLVSLTIGTGVLSIGSNQWTPKKTIWLTNTPPSGWTNLKGTINYVANEQYGNSSNVKVYPYLSSMFETNGIKYVPISPSERTCDAIDCNYDSAVEEINIGETVSYRGVAMTVKNVMPYVAYGQKTVKQLSVSHKGDIGASAFYGCTALTTTTISNEGCIGASAFYGCSAITNATISNKYYIDREAFRGCSSLTSLTLGDSITSIGESAFRECSSLTEVKIPKLVKQLSSTCFANTTALKHVELCDNLQKINSYCFSGSGLESISIPPSLKSIANYAFENCANLADVVIEDRTADLSLGSNGSSPLFADCPLDSVYIGGNITYSTSSSYGYSPFYRNTSLRSVVITDQEEEISDNEFYGCTNLKNVTIGSNVKKIGNWAFSGCSNLDYFSFGKSVETIGQETFSDCVNLTKLISYAEVPPTCGTMALDDINKWNCVLQVPGDCISAYQQANQWKEFFFIEDVLTAIGGVTIEGVTPATVDVYSTNGMLIKRNAELKSLKHELPAGIYIIGGKKVWVK